MNYAESPAFTAVRKHYRSSDEPAGGEDFVALAAFDEGGPPPDQDPRMVLRYLRDLGVLAPTLDQLHDGINGLSDEEELAAHWCREGLAVSHASDGSWFLFLEDRT